MGWNHQLESDSFPNAAFVPVPASAPRLTISRRTDCPSRTWSSEGVDEIMMLFWVFVASLSLKNVSCLDVFGDVVYIIIVFWLDDNLSILIWLLLLSLITMFGIAMTNSRSKQQKTTQRKFSESIPSQAIQAFLAQRKLRFRDTARPVKIGWIGHPWMWLWNF